jgi:hypothetical protein
VSRLATTLQAFAGTGLVERPFALVGGLAVSARTQPRFTRDIDLAIAVTGDAEAEAVVFGLQRRGYAVVASIEHQTAGRLATVRLREDPRAPLVDLLFASCGIETEIVAAASTLEVLHTTVRVAHVGHLMAMKLLSRDAKRRPRDQQDLVELVRVADENDWRIASSAVDLIERRGFARGRPLSLELRALREG